MPAGAGPRRPRAGEWVVRACCGQSTGGDFNQSRRAGRWARLAFSGTALLISVASFNADAVAADCGGIGRGPFTPCPTPTADAASANSHLSSGAGVIELGTQYLQLLSSFSSFKTAASSANNPQGGGAEPDAQRFRTWFEGYGLRSVTSAQGTFTGDSRKTYGGVAGIGMTVAPGVNVGLSVDQGQTLINVAQALQTGRIDLTQVGALATFEHGPWNLGVTAVRGFGDVHSNRVDVGGASLAAYHAQLWAAMTELSYYWALPDNSRFVPKLTFDWMQSRTDAFTETGGATPVSGSAVTATRARMLIGGEIGHSWLLDRRVMDVSVYGRFVDNMSQRIGSLQVALAGGASVPVLVAGVRESDYGADAGTTLSAKVTDAMRLYLVYDGRYRSNFVSHSGTVGAEFHF
jgi:uncharacterized protein with beta-barrel porin domain